MRGLIHFRGLQLACAHVVQESERIRMDAEESLEVLREEAKQATERNNRILKGLDLAFLFDVTGSMVRLEDIIPTHPPPPLLPSLPFSLPSPIDIVAAPLFASSSVKT